MKDGPATARPLGRDLAGLTGADWLDALEDMAGDRGFFEPLGKDHSAAFLHAGATLLVTFESLPEIFGRSDAHEPRGFDFVRDHGWSHLAILSHDTGWFRHDKLYRYFDRLIDDGFFDGFDRVLFFGTHQGGYAAAAYCVACPGARVLALRPVATLDPELAGWDTRALTARRLSFDDRFGFAPDMIEAAAAGYIVYDPREPLDAMHAALFRRPGVVGLPVRGAGEKLDTTLDALNITGTLIEQAMAGTLTRTSFAPLWRARRDNLPYLRALLGRLEAAGRLTRAARVCRHVLNGRNRPHFARRLDAITAQLAANKDQTGA